MKIAKNYRKYVFALEGDWTDDLRKKSSIEDALAFLERNSDIKYIHRHFSTNEEFFSRLHEFRKRQYFAYSILYIAAHGFPNGIYVGNREITLDEIADNSDGELANKIIHFGCCETLDLDKRYLNRFLSTTKALCVSGFKKDIPFIRSTIFDLLYFEICQENKDVRSIEDKMKYYYGYLLKELDFRMVYL